jgi:hypothetical protein
VKPDFGCSSSAITAPAQKAGGRCEVIDNGKVKVARLKSKSSPTLQSENNGAGGR